MIHPGLAALEK
jgi:hypothetical protein